MEDTEPAAKSYARERGSMCSEEYRTFFVKVLLREDFYCIACT